MTNTYALFSAVLALAGAPAAADDYEEFPMIEIAPVDGDLGLVYNHGICQCVRLRVQVEGLAGEIETKEFKISTRALFRYLRMADLGNLQTFKELFTVGELEAVWKRGHVGIGFEGVTIGSEIDVGYSDIIRTGVYALIRIAATSAAALDFHSGVSYETMRVNMGETIERTLLPQELSFHWGTDHFRGEVRASVAMNPRALTWDALKFNTGASLEVRLGRVLGFVPGIGIGVDFDHDPLREAFGMAANSLTGAVYLDLSWEPGFLRIGRGDE